MNNQAPGWLKELIINYKTGICNFFILWGNIYDRQRNLKGDYLDLNSYLKNIFEQRDLVMFYSLSSGLSFAKDEMENKFRSNFLASNGTCSPASSPTNAAATALQQKREASLTLSQRIGETPDKALKFLEKVLTDSGRNKLSSALIIDFAHNIAPNQASHMSDRIQVEILEHWAKNKAITQAGSIIILIAPSLSCLAENLGAPEGGALAIRIAKPDEKEREIFWKECLKTTEIGIEDELTAPVLGRLTGGLNLNQINRVYSLAKTKRQALSLGMIKNEKRLILQQELGKEIKFEEPRCGFGGFGGEDHIKEILTDIQKDIFDGILRRVPMGLLIIGPPGTGKTEIVRCWAWECGFNFATHQNPRDKYVGSSENKFLGFLAALDDASPIIVVEDEADQSETQRDLPSGDSGVSNRLRQMKFDFCSDEKRRGKVIWVRISNRPDLIDPAYLRDSRTDYTFAMLPPFRDTEKLKTIFKIMPTRENIPVAVDNYDRLAELAAEKIYCTGASVRKIMMVADRLAKKEGRKIVEEKHISEAILSWSISPRMAEEIDRQTILAIESSDIRPSNWGAIYNEAEQRLSGKNSEVRTRPFVLPKLAYKHVHS
jgi:transitional endoplasmic reticulum ATPase